MKKTILSLLAIVATMNVMAITYGGKATITLTSADNKSCKITIAQSDELNDGLNNGYFAELNMEGREVALYALYNGVKYQQFASKTINELQLGVMTNASTEYTLKVTNVSGTPLKLKIGNELITLTEGLTKSLTLAANQSAADLGVISPAIPAQAEDICFRYGIISVANQSGKTLVVADESGVEKINTTIASDYEEFNVSAYPAGHYTIQLGAKTLTISVQ